MDKPRKYEAKYKQEAVKLAKEVGAKKASEELKIPYGTLYDWIKKERKGAIETGEAKTPAEAMSLAEEIQKLRKENKALSAEVALRDKSLEEMGDELAQARNDYNSLMMAKMIEITDGDMESAQRRLAKLIREVNKCITLISEK